jgi:hypothetical protein
MEERLAKLERTARHSRLVLVGMGIVVLASAAVWVLAGATSRAQAQNPDEAGKVVRAEEFRLVGKDGKTCAMLKLLAGEPCLALYDQTGKRRVALGLLKSGEPELELCDLTGKSRAVMGMDESGQPWLELRDQTGEARAVLGASETTTQDGGKVSYPESSLILFSPAGSVVWQAP